jgi:flagellar motor switch protein FliG
MKTGLAPISRDTPALAGISASAALSGPQKAAVIVRLLIADGAAPPLSKLSEQHQARLADQIARMPAIDRATLDSVMEEFAERVDAIGLSFPDALSGALDLLDGHIAGEVAERLRAASGTGAADPWERVAGIEAARVAALLSAERVEVAAVALARLPVPRAAEILGAMPGERARRIAHAVSQTGGIDPATVRRIGESLAAELDAEPARAFPGGPVERVGAILNSSPAAVREDVLRGLDETDSAFAEQVRKAIFTFANIPTRIDPRDVPRIIRGLGQDVVITAIAGAKGADAAAAEFILASISQRMAAALRDEAAARGTVKDKDADAAMTAIVGAIRDLESAGEIFLIADEET